MGRLARILASLLVLATMAGAFVIWVGIPYMERRWTFFPARSASADRWKMPADATEVVFPTGQGASLTGWFFGARSPPNGITVLLLHGNMGVLTDFIGEVQKFQALGFNLLMFNYRGFGKSGGATLSEATVDGDGTAALRYLTHDRGIDPRSIVFLGVSLGAAIAADLATSSPCRAVALVGGFASAKRQAINLQAWRDRAWLPDILLDLLGSPFDTVSIIGQTNCPVLIVHSESDPIVPFEQAQSLFNAAHAPKRLIVVPGVGHNLPPPASRYIDEMASFFINGR